MDLSVALPTFLFTKDSKAAPLMLLALVGCGILLPLGAASWFMLSDKKYTGPNGVMQETLAFYYYSKFSVKEAQVGVGGLGRGARQGGGGVQVV